jgi:hypothetical protein
VVLVDRSVLTNSLPKLTALNHVYPNVITIGELNSDYLVSAIQHSKDTNTNTNTNVNFFITTKQSYSSGIDPCIPTPTPTLFHKLETPDASTAAWLIVLITALCKKPTSLPVLLLLFAASYIKSLCSHRPLATHHHKPSEYTNAYYHVESDEQVFQHLTDGILHSHSAKLPLLTYYHLQVHDYAASSPSAPAAIYPVYQTLGLAGENYDKGVFHHPPLFSLLSAAFVNAGGSYPNFPIVLATLPPLLLLAMAEGERETSRNAYAELLTATAYVLSPTVSFASMKFWSDNAIPPFILLALVLALRAASAPAERGRVRSSGLFLLAGFSAGFACLIKVTSLAVVPGLLLCVLYRHQKSLTMLLFDGLAVVAPVVTLFGAWVWYYVTRTSSAGAENATLSDVISSMWPSENLVNQSNFMQACNSREIWFYVDVLVRLWPVSILVIPSMSSVFSQRVDALSKLKIVVHATTVMAYILPFTLIGYRGGLFQSRHVLPCLPSLAILIGEGWKAAERWTVGKEQPLFFVRSLVLFAVVISAINSAVAVLYVATVEADLTKGAFDVASGFSTVEPLPELQNAGEAEILRRHLRFYGIME